MLGGAMRSEELAYLTSDRDGRPCIEFQAVGDYPDGMPLMRRPAREVTRVLLRPRGMLGLMAGLFWVDAIAERGIHVPELVLPFVPGSRQDRLNDAGDFLFTAKSVANEINARNFPRVIVLDPHSDVTPAVIDRCHVVHASECLPTVPLCYDAVVSPDGGAEKRASKVALLLKLPLLHAWKTRSVSSGALTGFGMETPSPGIRHVLVVDDICDGGGTFLGLSAVVREQRLTADLFVTHGIFSKGTAELKASYRTIYCTDSVIAGRQDVVVNHVAERILEKGTP